MSLQLVGSLIVVLMFWCHWRASIIIHSLVYHRAGTHKSFEFGSRKAESLFKFLSVVILGPSILSVRAYCVMHRMHHAHSDTDKDPHRPYPGFIGFFKTIIFTSVRYGAIFKGDDSIDIDGERVQIEEKFTENLPINWPVVDRLFHNWIARLAWVMLYVAVYALIINYFGLSEWFYVLVVFHASMAPLHGVIVNYGAHKFGYHPHNTGDTSRNFSNFWQKFVGLYDETLHNNHHFRPGVADFSLGKGRSFPFVLLLFLEEKGIVKNVKKAI